MIALVGPAWGWTQATTNNCTTAAWASGTTSVTYRVNTADFSSAEIAEIEAAADAWHGGSGTNLRGVNWEYVRGADVTSDGSSNSSDGINTLGRKPNSFFTVSGTKARTARWVNANCVIVEADIWVNSSLTTSNVVPSALPWENVTPTQHSLGQLFVHEFGHAAGLDHSDLNGSSLMLATMNTQYPGGGDISAVKYRISEDDYVGHATLHPGSSTEKTS